MGGAVEREDWVRNQLYAAFLTVDAVWSWKELHGDILALEQERGGYGSRLDGEKCGRMNVNEHPNLAVESSGVQKHLEITQSIIARMAENSRSCKLWCVTLVAATLVLIAQTGEPKHALIALVPTVLFLILDTYYLALERAFRSSYNLFVDRLHRSKITPSDLYKVNPIGMGWRLAGRCLMSVSILPFYILLVLTIGLAWILILPPDSI